MQPVSRHFRRPSSRRDFHIAIICALALEYDAASLLVDEFWDQHGEYGRVIGDTNIYRNGRIGAHDIVLVVLPGMGKALVAGSAANLRTSYPSLRLVILLGICGGVPSRNVFLGDVIISEAIVQYDLGRQYPGQFITKGAAEGNLGSPNKDIRSLMAWCRSQHGREDLRDNAAIFLRTLQDAASEKRYQVDYRYPELSRDQLYRAAYRHKHTASQPPCTVCSEGVDEVCSEAIQASCAELGCPDDQLVHRPRPTGAKGSHEPCPDIFVGRVASGDTVMKSGEHRDKIANQHDIIAFEMEGAGAWDEVPCIVVKGICDYADSHKSKGWQPYAAATASAVVKAILKRYTLNERSEIQSSAGGSRSQQGEVSCSPEEGVSNMSVAENSSLVKAVRINAGRPLRDAILDFKDILTADERRDLRGIELIPARDVVLVFTAQLDSRNRNRRGPSIASRLYSVLQSVRDFAAAAAEEPGSSEMERIADVWRIIKLTMLVAFDSAYYEALSMVFMKIGQHCPQASGYHPWCPASARLKKALFNFYASIVRCCRHVMETVRLPWQRRMFKALWETVELEFQPDIEDVQRCSLDIGEELSSVKKAEAELDYGRLAKDRASTGKWKLATKFPFKGKAGSKTYNAPQVQRDDRGAVERRQQRLDSLSKHDYLTPLKQSRRKRYSGTAQWLFETQEFDGWIAGANSPLLWCSGKIGSGKTILTASIIDKILIERPDSDHLITFFFVQFDDRLSIKAEIIVKSILRQALDQSGLTDKLEEVLGEAQVSLAGVEKLLDVFRHLVVSLRRLYILIDGLDECEKPERGELLKILSSLAALGSNIRIFLSGRDSVSAEVERRFPSRHNVFVSSSLTRPDIDKYIDGAVQDKLESEELVVRDATLVQEIKMALREGAEGMFLWVSFQLFELCSKHCDDDIRQTISNLPKGLTATFNRALERITSQGNAKVARQAFLWIACAKRPLTVDELGEAMFLEIGQQFSKPQRVSNDVHRISSWCENLAHVDEEQRIVQFPHETVRQFLTEGCSDERFAKFRIDVQESDHFVGEICITYLDFNDFKTTLARRPRKLPLISPSDIAQTATGYEWKKAAYIPVFGKLGTGSDRSSAAVDISGALTGFKRDYWRPTKRSLENSHPFLRYASASWIFHTKGFTKEKSKTWLLWERMVTQGHDLVRPPWGAEVSEAEGATMLDWSFEARHYALVDLLMKMGAVPLPKRIQMMMELATRGELAMLDVLLQDQMVATRLQAVCQAAVRSGQVDVVQRLIAAGASPDDALNEAAKIGHADLVEWLIPASINTSHGLEVAAKNGHLVVVECFLVAGVTAHWALREAARNGHLHVVTRLLRADEEKWSAMRADDEGKDEWSVDGLLGRVDGMRAAARAAAEGGFLDVVDFLQLVEERIEKSVQTLLG